ncbi:MAG: TetR/AcrR family transcriptional regulator [Candidatus Lustribacter sp.]
MTARRAAAAETKERIEAAAVALYRQGSLDDFTLDDVAERAQTTVQTVLRVFGSKENLVLAALRAMAAAGTPVRATPPGDVDAAVAAIYDVYETIGDLVIDQLADERRRPALKPALDAGRENHRDWVRQIFAAQLNARRGSARTQLFNILVVALDVYVWKLLRRDLALSRSAARAAVRTIIAGVIDAENSSGTNPLAELVGRR